MGLKTIPFRDIEEKAENMYEAVSAMSGQAKLELQERIVNKAILSHQEEELDVFDEVEEISPDSYEELVHSATFPAMLYRLISFGK